MTTYADLAWGQDLLEGALDRANEKIDATSGYYEAAKGYTRIAYWEVLRSFPWPFAKAPRPKTVTLLAPVTVTINSIVGATVTLSATLTPTMAGRKLTLANTASWYRILTHTAGTATLTLDASWVETPTSGTGTIYQDEYDLDPLVLAVFGPLQPRGGTLWYPVHLLEEPEFRAKYPVHVPLGPGPLAAACVIRHGDFNTVNQFAYELSAPIRIQVVPYPHEPMVLEFDYAEWHYLSLNKALPNPNAAQPYVHDLPKIPRPDRVIVAELAASYLLRDKKDFEGSDRLRTAANTYLAGMVSRYLPATLRRFMVRPRNSLCQGIR